MNCDDLKNTIIYEDFQPGSLDSYILNVSDKIHFIKVMWPHFLPQDIHVLFTQHNEIVNEAITLNDKHFSLFVVFGRCYADMIRRSAEIDSQLIYSISDFEQKYFRLANTIKEFGTHLSNISL